MSNLKFNEYQEKAIFYDGNKPLLIEAGPGAGKTRVLVERVKFLIKDKHINPESLLVITFTEKAANELKERLTEDSEIGINLINKMQISTIHSFCYTLLSEYGSPGLDIIDDEFNERKDMFLRKHKKDLGFEYEYYIPNSQLNSVINKFNEYSTFNVDTEGLIDYIINTHPIDESYLDYIEECKINSVDYFEFPYDEVRENQVYKESWYNAKYLAVAKAYPKYLELLETESSCDFNSLQLKALKLLKNPEVRKNVRFKNLLIDEFQDTDPIQMQIFNALLEGSESFTVVGDDDQSIYGFRGSFPKFFTDFSKTHDSEVITLKTNYRSTPNIVNFNENFIKNERVHSKDLVAAREKDSHVFYMENNSKDNQAERIVAIIKHLKENGKIKQYSDVGLLFRAIHSNKSGISELKGKLYENNIPFKEDYSLIDFDEVKSIITLLWYMTKDMNPKILTKWEKDWLNLTAFTNENFNSSKMFNLSNDTMNILSQLEYDYRNKVIDTEHEVYEELKGKKSGIRKFHGVFNREEEILNEIFNRIEKPDISKMSRDDLINLGIQNEHDLDFFNKLYNIKKEFYDSEIDFYKKPTILETYYKLLNLTGYLDNKFDNDNTQDKIELMNLAFISNTIYNYEDIIYKHDINGLFWFLNGHLDDYASPDNEKDDLKDEVQIMTIHSSKGLEFPVVILCSLEEDVFPRKYDPEHEQKDFIAGMANFYTPNKFLKYKNHDIELEKENYEKEENRTIYVAMTRAEDILIVSSLPHITKKDEDDILTPKILKTMINNNPDLIELNLDNLSLLDMTEAKKNNLVEENIDLSFTSFSEYEFCPHKYDLIYNYKFQNSRNISMTFGLIVHSILNKIHIKAKTSEVTHEDIDTIIKATTSSNENIKKENDNKLNEILNKIYDYWDKYGQYWTVLGSEIPFNILKHNYNLNGQIDLIIKENNANDITLIDFKTTTSEKVKLDLSTYIQQLYIYMIALRENPDYKQYNIKHVMIFTVLDTTPIYIDIDENKIEELSKLIDKTADKIINEEYDKNLKNCGICEYRFTVCKNIRQLNK